MEDGKCEFSLLEVGAEGLAGILLAAGEIQAIVVNLVGRAEAEAEGLHRGDDLRRGFVDEGAQLAGGGEEGGGFHLDDAEVIRDAELEVKAALGLDDLAGANIRGGAGDAPGDFAVGEVGGKLEGMGEEAIAQEDRDGVAPLGIDGGLGAALLGAVHDIVMDEGGGMDELEDDGEIQVAGVDIPGGAACEEGKGGAEALAAALDRVGDVGLHSDVKCACLLRDPLLDAVELGVDEFQRLFDVPGGIGFVPEIPDEFHNERVSAGFLESQWLQEERQKWGRVGGNGRA